MWHCHKSSIPKNDSTVLQPDGDGLLTYSAVAVITESTSSQNYVIPHRTRPATFFPEEFYVIFALQRKSLEMWKALEEIIVLVLRMERH